MRYLARFLCLAVMISGCGSSSPAALQPAAPPALVASAPLIHSQISIGQVVNGTLDGHGSKAVFELTAPSSGTLVVTVSWDRTDGIVEMSLGGRQFGYELGNPLTGRVTVAAGQKYLVTIADAAPWDYDPLHLPYSFRGTIE